MPDLSPVTIQRAMFAIAGILAGLAGAGGCARLDNPLIPPAAAATPVTVVSTDAAQPRADAPTGAANESSASPAISPKSALSCPSRDIRRRSSADAHGDLERVRIGWAIALLRKVAGDPQSCHGRDWYYTAGPSDGPLVTFTFTIVNGKVAKISRANTGCIYRL